MHLKRTILLLALGAVLLFGCAPTPLDINRFALTPGQEGVRTVTIADETYAEYQSQNFRVIAALFEYNGVIVNSLEIVNNSAKDLPAADYSVSLADGRDQMPIKMLSRQDLTAARAQLTGSSPGGAIQDRLLQSAVDAILNSINASDKEKLVKVIDEGVEKYFAFRPVYTGERRSGIISFLPDFRLEYPLTLTVKLRGEVTRFRFNPKKII